MGYYFSPDNPGTVYGPCDTPCNHTDCAKMRQDVESLCRICNKPIGYKTRIYFEDNNTMVHADCLESETDKLLYDAALLDIKEDEMEEALRIEMGKILKDMDNEYDKPIEKPDTNVKPTKHKKRNKVTSFKASNGYLGKHNGYWFHIRKINNSWRVWMDKDMKKITYMTYKDDYELDASYIVRRATKREIIEFIPSAISKLKTKN